jgi:hypothetical protein
MANVDPATMVPKRLRPEKSSLKQLRTGGSLCGTKPFEKLGVYLFFRRLNPLRIHGARDEVRRGLID